MPADRAPRPMTHEERETWAWFARWAAIARAFAIAEREGAPAGTPRLRRARQLLDPRATDAHLDAIVDHARRQTEAGEPGLLDPPRLVDIAGPSMARRIVEAGLIEGAVAERELEPAARRRLQPETHLARPEGSATTAWGEPMPDVVEALRRSRAGH